VGCCCGVSGMLLWGDVVVGMLWVWCECGVSVVLFVGVVVCGFVGVLFGVLFVGVVGCGCGVVVGDGVYNVLLVRCYIPSTNHPQALGTNYQQPISSSNFQNSRQV
jgi:hypothetical protein